jgi:integrase
MRSTFKILFYLKRDKQKSNGLIPLYCRITVDGAETRFGMKCDVNPKYWDVKTGKATGRTSEATQINQLMDKTQASIYHLYREMQERDNYVTAEKIKNVFLGIEQKQQTILELFDIHNNERKLQIGISFSKSSYDKYRITRQCLADFIISKLNLKDIPVKEINKQFISDFESFLFVQYEYSQNNVTTLLKKFRHVIEVGINKEWIYKNPFRDYKLHWEKTDRGYLTQVEIEKLINSQFENGRIEVARDIFIFCCFTGLAYTDIKHLTTDNIQSSFDGKLWIRGKRKKTSIAYDIPLLNIPKAILEKYREKMQNNLLLPVFCISSYNWLLKKMAIYCEIEKNISSHVARHTAFSYQLKINKLQIQNFQQVTI